MANQFGKEYRIYVGDGDEEDEVFTAIGGETSFSYQANTPDIDLTDKDGAKTSYGTRSHKFALKGNLKLPDVGFSALYAASKASPPHVNIQVKRGAVIKWQGLVAVGNMNYDADTNGPIPFTADLSNADTPVVDNLVAAA